MHNPSTGVFLWILQNCYEYLFILYNLCERLLLRGTHSKSLISLTSCSHLPCISDKTSPITQKFYFVNYTLLKLDFSTCGCIEEDYLITYAVALKNLLKVSNTEKLRGIFFKFEQVLIYYCCWMFDYAHQFRALRVMFRT